MDPVVRAAVAPALLLAAASIPRGADVSVRFTDVAASVGIVLPRIPISTAKDFLVDTTGNGVALFDADRDDHLDVRVVTGSTFAQLKVGGSRMVTLSRTDGGHFTDVTGALGLARRGWG